VIQGAIFVVTVLLFRRGIVGEIMALAQYLQRRSRPAPMHGATQQSPAE
jgi:hypothetical protein